MIFDDLLYFTLLLKEEDIVLVTKYRKQTLKGIIADDTKQKIYDMCNIYRYESISKIRVSSYIGLRETYMEKKKTKKI